MANRTIGGTLSSSAVSVRSAATQKAAAMQSGRSAMAAADVMRTSSNITKAQTAPTVVSTASTAPTRTVNAAMSGKIITPQ